MNGFTTPTLQFLIAMTQRAASTAANIFSQPELFATEWKEDQTPQTAADRAVHRAVTDILSAEFPRIPVIGEEGEHGKRTGSKDELWLSLDEVDGTTAFTYGIPVFTTLVALMQGDDVVKSVIHDPIMQRTYSAELGKGAMLNGKPIRTCQTLPKNANVGVATWPRRGRNDMLLPRMVSGVIRELHDQNYCFTEAGTIGYLDALVASGILVGTIFPGDKVHDSVAGDLLVREAGGISTDLWGKPLSYPSGTVNGHIYACNAEVHEQLLNIVAKHDNRSRHQFP